MKRYRRKVRAGDEARTRDSLLGRQTVAISPLARKKSASTEPKRDEIVLYQVW
jgi:hypothetical protein